MRLYSVVLLLETIDIEDKPYDKTCIYEESTILIKIKKDLIENSSYLEILSFFQINCNSQIITNAYGDRIYNKVVKILDCYEILDISIEEFRDINNFSQVYSRYHIFDEYISLDRLMDMYYSDYLKYGLEANIKDDKWRSI